MTMFGYDFLIYYEAARALLAGLSPYQVDGFFSPITLAVLFIPLALIPAHYATIVWVVINAVCLVVFAKRKAPLAVAFAPILFLGYVGQIDLFVITLGMLGGWPGLVLSTIKPQLAVWLWMYWLWVSPRKIKYAFPATVAIYSYSQLVYPWVGDWLVSTPGLDVYASRSASMFGFAAIVGSIVYPSVLGWMVLAGNWLNRKNYFLFMAAFNPVSNIYTYSLLANQITVVEIALSWLALPASMYLHTGAPFLVVPLSIAIRNSGLGDDIRRRLGW